jgi:hypothetical protein
VDVAFTSIAASRGYSRHLLTRNHFNAGRSTDQDHGRHVDEQAVNFFFAFLSPSTSGSREMLRR